ncbi:DUF4291 family protein [Nonomuraea sp. NPDC048881]|uniref:DUF4291 family protein n=1 Tax=Nonomuraea sp. NPDC048881 TaxID=3155030 RepID=UPI0033CE916F
MREESGRPFLPPPARLSGDAVTRYLDQWILAIDDLTDRAHGIHQALRQGRDVTDMLPAETPYPLPLELAQAIGATIAPDLS